MPDPGPQRSAAMLNQMDLMAMLLAGQTREGCACKENSHDLRCPRRHEHALQQQQQQHSRKRRTGSERVVDLILQVARVRTRPDHLVR